MRSNLPVRRPSPVPPLRMVDAAGHALPLYDPPWGHPSPAPWIGLDALFGALVIPEAERAGFVQVSGLVTASQGSVRTISPVLAALYVNNAQRFGFVSDERAAAIRTALDLEEAAHAAV